MSPEEKIRRLETDSNWLEIELPIEPGECHRERVIVERQPEGRYRIAATPGFVEGMAAGDVIELPRDDPLGFKVVSRGGNLAVRFTCADEPQFETATAFLSGRLAEMDGYLDATMAARGLTYTIPLRDGFAAIERVFGEALTRFPGSAWWFGNVYDANDQPLNWWLDDTAD